MSAFIVDGIIYDLSEKIELDRQKHNIEIVVDRLVVKERAFEAGLPIPLKQQQVFFKRHSAGDVTGEEKLYSRTCCRSAGQH